MSFLTALFLGFVISFVGSIPPASINLTAVRISLERARKEALWFSFGAVLLEGVFCYISLRFASYIAAHQSWEFWIKWMSVLVFFILGIAAFIPIQNTSSKELKKQSTALNAFGYGVFLSLVNPLQIPFWLAYGTYFYSNQWLDSSFVSTLMFVFGAMAGTFALLYVFVVYAAKVLARILKNTLSGKQLIGFIFLGLAFFQLGQNLWELFKAR